jgi:hypothetical protein
MRLTSGPVGAEWAPARGSPWEGDIRQYKLELAAPLEKHQLRRSKL